MYDTLWALTILKSGHSTSLRSRAVTSYQKTPITNTWRIFRTLKKWTAIQMSSTSPSLLKSLPWRRQSRIIHSALHALLSPRSLFDAMTARPQHIFAPNVQSHATPFFHSIVCAAGILQPRTRTSNASQWVTSTMSSALVTTVCRARRRTMQSARWLFNLWTFKAFSSWPSGSASVCTINTPWKKIPVTQYRSTTNCSATSYILRQS